MKEDNIFNYTFENEENMREGIFGEIHSMLFSRYTDI